MIFPLFCAQKKFFESILRYYRFLLLLLSRLFHDAVSSRYACFILIIEHHLSSLHASLSPLISSCFVLSILSGSLASPITVAIAADLALNLVGVFTYAQLIKHVHMGEEPQEFFTYVTQDGPFSPRDNNDVDIYSDLFVPRTYDNSHSTFSRSDSLVGRSGKGEKHFQGEKHYPLGRFMGASSPEHLSLSDRSRDKRVDLNCMGLKINLQGIMPNTGAHTAHANKYSDADTGHSQEARSQLEKVSARSFHSTDSNDSYNDSDMFYNVGTSRSGFSEGAYALAYFELFNPQRTHLHLPRPSISCLVYSLMFRHSALCPMMFSSIRTFCSFLHYPLFSLRM